MTDEERKEIDPEFCAEGLRYILQTYFHLLDFPETAVIVGTIALLRDKSDGFAYQKASDEWKQRIFQKERYMK